ncbi:MAG: histidine kinase dimerization/phospho-acceptor domain-containing protein [Sphingobium sp.]
MRFNDLTQTILAVKDRTGTASATLWRQCVDVLAQYDRAGKSQLDADDRDALVARLADLRGELSEAQRIGSVVELGTRLRSPALIEFFANDRPAVCAAAITRARLPDDVWPTLLARLGPTARGVLRGRRDIGPETRRALEAFGSTDLVLGELSGVRRDNVQDAQLVTLDNASIVADEPVEIAAPPPEPEEDAPHHQPVSDQRSQIRQLVERIERFTTTYKVPAPSSETDEEGDVASVAQAELASLRSFPFETDAEGMMIWVGEASRTALVGLSIAQPALPGETGPDGHVAGAFVRRSSFQHGRLFIGEGLYEGEWRLSAIPFFDPASGRFQGYRGQARRPLIHEIPQKVPSSAAQAAGSASLDSMRQLIHELRTPLNAILGFAEIIEQQLFGPAGVHYREMAGNILSDARRLLSAFDDIEIAVRTGVSEAADALSQNSSAIDLSQLVDRVAALYEEQAAESVRNRRKDGPRSRLRIAASADLPLALGDPVQCERMIQHLARTLVSLSPGDEVVQGALWFQPDGAGGRLVLGFDRPQRLRGLEENQMLDPGYGSDGDWPDAPLLGLGFSMRLIRSLAQAQGGALRIESDRILVELPVADAALLADDETG